MLGLVSFIQKQWFLCGLLSVFILSAALPTLPEGDWQRTSKLGLVFMIFLFSGVSIQTGELVKGLFNYRLHVLIQVISLLVLPLVMMTIVYIIKPMGLPRDFELGLLILGALPTTVTSCVAFTTLAGGNVVGALVNASVGNLLGIFITPLWLVLYTQGTPFELELLPVLEKLGITVFLPLFIGQVIQTIFKEQLSKKRRKRIGISGQSFVLGILYLSMQNAYAQGGSISPMMIFHGVWMVSLYHMVALLLPWFFASAISLKDPDRICALFCASQKTLALGIPLISICFPNHSGLPLLALGILLYHPIQLLIAAFLADRLKISER